MHYVKLLIEPVALVWLGLLWLTVSLWFGRASVSKKQRMASVVLLLSFWFVASPFGANALVWSLERNYRSAELCDGASADDTIVILGGGKKGSSAAPDEVEALMEATLVRTFAGLRLWQQLERKPAVVLSGGGYGDVREADLMALLAEQAGVPAEQLLLERESRSTRENAQGVRGLFERKFDGKLDGKFEEKLGEAFSGTKELGAESSRIFLVTSAMHMPRARSTFTRFGFDVCPWPVDQRAFRPDFGGLWIPSIRPLQKSSMALHEFKGLLWYWLLE